MNSIYNYSIHFSPDVHNEYSKCTIHFKNESSINTSLVKSITKANPLLNLTIVSNYEKIHFMCRSFISLHQYISELPALSYSTSYLYKIMYDITCQYKYLVEMEKKTFIGFHPDHIYVIDHNKFVYLDGEFICKIDANKQIQLTVPFFKTSFFYAPELFSICELPQSVHYKCAYYSLAVMFIYIHLLKTKWIDKDSELESEEEKEEEENENYQFIQQQLQKELQDNMIQTNEMSKFLSPTIHISSLIYETLSSVLIYNSKMYFFWIKCFHADSSKRFICFL